MSYFDYLTKSLFRINIFSAKQQYYKKQRVVPRHRGEYEERGLDESRTFGPNLCVVHSEENLAETLRVKSSS